MTKQELIDKIQSHTPSAVLPKTVIDNVLTALAMVVQDELAAGGDVTLPGVGKLGVKPTAARTGRNPKTGEVLEIAAGRKLTFKPLLALKQAVDR